MVTAIVEGLMVGILGALIMSQMMQLVSCQWPLKINMVRAVGGLVTNNYEREKVIGLGLHLIGGALFGAIYFFIFRMLGLESILAFVGLGLGLSFFHGLIVTYCLMFYVDEVHPRKEYRKATFYVGFAHILGHLVFGLVCGLGAAILA